MADGKNRFAFFSDHDIEIVFKYFATIKQDV